MDKITSSIFDAQSQSGTVGRRAPKLAHESATSSAAQLRGKPHCSKYVWHTMYGPYDVWMEYAICVWLCLSQIKGKRSGNPHPNEIILWHQVISIIYDVIPHDKDLYLPLAYCIR